MNRLRTLLLIALCGLALTTQAQSRLQTLIGDYLEAKQQQQDATASIARLNTVYKQMKPAEQAAFRDTVYNAITASQQANQNLKSLALIDLYQFFADANDPRLPVLYYIKGEISALELNDIIALQNAIDDLLACNPQKVPQAEQYITTLRGYLTDIQNYIPVINRMDGIWMSVHRFTTRTGSMPGGLPYWVLKIKHLPGYVAIGFEQTCWGGGSYKTNNFLNWNPFGWKLSAFNLFELDTSPQKVVDLRNDCVYMMWASEKLDVSNPIIESAIRSTTTEWGSSMATSLFSSNSSSFLGDLGSSIVSGLVSNGINSLLDGLFTPNKTITILEARFQKINDYEIKANMLLQFITARGNEQPQITTHTLETLFTKWDPNSGIYFFDDSSPFVYGGTKYSAKAMETTHKDELARIRLLNKKMKSNERYEAFNIMQAKRMFYLNEQEMIRQGLPMDSNYHSSQNRTRLGCRFSALSDHPEVTSVSSGVYVSEVPTMLPAYLYGIRKGDVILSIDGFEMTSPDMAVEFIQSLTPFTTATFKVMRNKKELEIPVTLSYRTDILTDN
ncbi:MAG: serine protease [Prevotella sp.]|nr:serine protease [Prevotella sp.]